MFEEKDKKRAIGRKNVEKKEVALIIYIVKHIKVHLICLELRVDIMLVKKAEKRKDFHVFLNKKVHGKNVFML